MIFATVGSTQIPFERLMRALDGFAGDRLFVQHGPVAAPAGAAWSRAYMQFPEVLKCMRRADVVVCHAGAGSILCALRAGHRPVVAPRLKRFGETVDDHQVEFAAALAAEGSVVAVDDLGGLREAIASAPPRRSPRRQADLLPIQAAVREVLHAPRSA
jgi:UDP-N-acetylglucosamine transferase subunit ALG13